MAKVRLQKDDSQPVSENPRKRSKIRIILGCVLVAAVVALALMNILPLRQRIDTADGAIKPLLWRGLQNHYVVFSAMLVVALGIAFGIMPARRPLALRIIGCIVWIAGLAVTADAVYLTAQTIRHSNRAEVAPEAGYVVVLGGELDNGNLPPDLAARLDTAAEWWKAHQGNTTLIMSNASSSIVAEEVTVVKAAVSNNLPGRKKKQGVTLRTIMSSALESSGVKSENENEILVRMETDSRNVSEAFDNILHDPAFLKYLNKKTADDDPDLNQLLEMKENDPSSVVCVEENTPIIVITNGCYMNETVLLAKNAGFTNISRLPAASSFSGYLTNALWETWLEHDPVLKAAE